MTFSTPNYQMLGFDLDGTLCDSLEGIQKSYKYVLDSLGFNESSDIRSVIGKPLASGLESLGIPKENVRHAVRIFREYYSQTGIFQAKLYPGIKRLLQQLSAESIPLFLITAKPTPYAQIVLHHFGIHAHFQSVRGLELDSPPVSKSAQLRSVMDQFHISPSSFCYVGDRSQDVQAGKDNGVACVGVEYGYGGHEELLTAGADYIAKDVSELSKLLGWS